MKPWPLNIHSTAFEPPRMVFHAASALEASTSIPRSSISFWQLALTAESSPAQVHSYYTLDV